MPTRVLTVFYIILCFAMGFVLLWIPWLPSWTTNFFTQHYLWLDVLARNNYVRGAVSGIGLADVGLGLYETRRFGRPSRAVDASSRISNEPPLSTP